MKRIAIVAVLLLCASSATAQISEHQLRDTTFAYWAKMDIPMKYFVIIDTGALWENWAKSKLDSTGNALHLEIVDTAAALSARMYDGAGGGGSSTGGELTTLKSLNIGDGYVTMVDDDGNEISVDDSCTVLVRAYVAAQSETGDSTAAYRLYAVARRLGTTLTVKDSALQYQAEDNPRWDVRFSAGNFSRLRIQAKADTSDTVRFTATVEVTRACKLPFDTTNYQLLPTQVADLNLWLDCDTNAAPGRFQYWDSLRSEIKTWYDQSDSAHNAICADSSQSYDLIYDSSRGAYGVVQHTTDSMTVGRMYVGSVFVVYRLDYEPGVGFSYARIFSPWTSAVPSIGMYIKSQAGGYFTLQPGLFLSGQERYNDSLSVDGGKGMYRSAQVLYESTGGAGAEGEWILENGGWPSGWQSTIYEVVSYSRALTSYERKGVYNYLKHKYNL